MYDLLRVIYSKKHIIRLCQYNFLIIAISCMLISCQATPATTPDATAISIPVPNNNNIIIRIDSVTINEFDGDSGLGGEIYFVLIALREYGASAKLILPGKDTFDMSVGDTEKLGKFSLGINDVKYSSNEEIKFFILGFESDEQSTRNEILTERAIETAVELATSSFPGGSLVPFLLENLTGSVLTWWEEEDILGEYSGILNQDNNWLVGRQYHVRSTNQNLEISFTILQNIDVLGTEPTENVLLTVVNSSSSSVEKLFISIHDCSNLEYGECNWGQNVLVSAIQPNETQIFEVPIGIYDLRAEDSTGLPWEISGLNLNLNQRWTITNGR